MEEHKKDSEEERRPEESEIGEVRNTHGLHYASVLHSRDVGQKKRHWLMPRKGGNTFAKMRERA